MIYVVSYDISSDRVRTKLAKLLEGYGVRIQYSVFECRLTAGRFQKMYREIFKLTEDAEEGSVRFYFICKNCEQKITTIGKPLGDITILEEHVIIV